MTDLQAKAVAMKNGSLAYERELLDSIVVKWHLKGGVGCWRITRSRRRGSHLVVVLASQVYPGVETHIAVPSRASFVRRAPRRYSGAFRRHIDFAC